MLHNIEFAIKNLANPTRAALMQRYFKTGKGDYAEGDIFWGLSNPQCRSIQKQFNALSLNHTLQLLQSPIHEKRFIALLQLIYLYNQALKLKNWPLQQEIANHYMHFAQLNCINNWDLVDVSAHKILGDYCYRNNLNHLIFNMANSNHLWLQRIAMVATACHIKNNLFEPTFKLTQLYLTHNHDLIHKATGWMLREVGKKDQHTLELFLASHYKKMPRTMLRYAIEKFNNNLRLQYLKGSV